MKGENVLTQKKHTESLAVSFSGVPTDFVLVFIKRRGEAVIIIREFLRRRFVGMLVWMIPTPFFT